MNVAGSAPFANHAFQPQLARRLDDGANLRLDLLAETKMGRFLERTFQHRTAFLHRHCAKVVAGHVRRVEEVEHGE